MLERYPFSKLFLEQASGIDGLSVVFSGRGAILIPPKVKYFYMPRIMIHDVELLETKLKNYISAIESTDILFTKIDQKHDIAYYLGILIKNLTNSDYQNFEEYVDMFTQFILDNTFSEFDEKKDLGFVSSTDAISVRRFSEFYGSETPYALKIWKKNRHMQYELPLIRYGIYQNSRGEKVARIFMVQRKKIYKQNELIKNMNKSFNPINSGVKEYRDIASSMVACMTVFIGMLYSRGIKNIEVADFIPRRYMHFKGVVTEEQRDNIQFHATDKYLRLFLRINNHLEGFDITAYPNDVDSFMHIRLRDTLKSKSAGLDPYLQLGMSSQNLISEKKLVKD